MSEYPENMTELGSMTFTHERTHLMVRASQASRSGVRTVGACLIAMMTVGIALVYGASASGGSINANSAQEVSVAQAHVALLEKTPSLGITTPLKSKPAHGKKVVWLEGNAESVVPLTAGVQAATAALGWQYTAIPFTYGDPQSTSSAMSQAVSEHPNFIVVSGQSVATLGQGLVAAKAAHIPVFCMICVNGAEGAKNDIYANPSGLPSNVAGANALMDFAIAKSKGAANILYVNYPDSPTLASTATAVDADLKKACAKCTVTSLNVSTADLGGTAIPGDVVAALQRNPQINYVFLAFSGLFSGVPQALQSAGFGSKVKLMVYEPDSDTLAAVKAGSVAAVLPLAQGETAWATLDEAARFSEGMNLDSAAHQVLSLTLWTGGNVPSGITTEWNGVENYQGQFEKLWHVK
jgi:ribose transport system substrate-binding protein